MKKIIILIAILFLLPQLNAAPVNNPLNPEIIEEGFFISPASWLNLRLGYEGNFISDARMDKSVVGSGKIDNLKIDVNSGSFTFNLQNRIDLFGILGASRMRSDWRFNSTGTPSRVELETNYRLLWAIGMKAIFFQWGNTVLSAGGRYTVSKPSLSWITVDGSLIDANSAKFSFKNWQIDLGLAQKIDIFIPYLGVKYLRSKAKVESLVTSIADDGSVDMHMTNRDNFGVFVGCSLSNSKYFMLSFEARVIDEEAITVSGELKF